MYANSDHDLTIIDAMYIIIIYVLTRGSPVMTDNRLINYVHEPGYGNS